ncbi:hypothetical protein [Xanthomonas sp. NCPPB 1128]|uniref:hypothetical protein n=1 Tax=Xanthomonas sp. NCPPB 1128 TaxID=1775876 RepID=UPI000ACAE916|nr:hypothetical protein [Xanthomonas sp. NCPPB 1128]
MDNSKNVKSRRALLISIIDNNGSLRVDLDDVVNNGGPDEVWKKKEHVTNKDISADDFDGLSFDEKELADFGYFVMARLYAYRSRGEN